MKFEITEEKEHIIENWYKSIMPKILDKQIEIYDKDFDRLTQHGKRPYYGTIGGGLTYSFIPTGLGTIIKIQESTTKEKLDITDYDKF